MEQTSRPGNKPPTTDQGMWHAGFPTLAGKVGTVSEQKKIKIKTKQKKIHPSTRHSFRLQSKPTTSRNPTVSCGDDSRFSIKPGAGVKRNKAKTNPLKVLARKITSLHNCLSWRILSRMCKMVSVAHRPLKHSTDEVSGGGVYTWAVRGGKIGSFIERTLKITKAAERGEKSNTIFEFYVPLIL